MRRRVPIVAHLPARRREDARGHRRSTRRHRPRRALSRPRTHRRGRHGPGLSRGAHAHRVPLRGEGSLRRSRVRSVDPVALPPRGRGRERPPEPAHRPRRRLRADRDRSALPRHGVPRRIDALRHHRARRAGRADACAPRRAAHLSWTRARARAGHRPSRHEGRERHPRLGGRRGRRAEAPRLRCRASPRGRG